MDASMSLPHSLVEVGRDRKPVQDQKFVLVRQIVRVGSVSQLCLPTPHGRNCLGQLRQLPVASERRLVRGWIRLSGPTELTFTSRGKMGGDVDLVDAVLVAFNTLGHGVPDPAQHLHLRQLGHAETAPVLDRPLRPEGLLARAVELIPKDMGVTGLGSEQEGTEDA
jgi:hypothetical protein